MGSARATDQTRVVQDGDSCWLITLGTVMSPHATARVHALMRAVEEIHPAWLVEMVPGYCTLGLIVRPLEISLQGVNDLIRTAMARVRDVRPVGGREILIPVCYGDSFGPDMQAVCQHAGLSESEVVRRHSTATYQCAMLGFLPGFPYLTGLDAQLAAPRLATPRTSIPAGSVGIAGAQTGVYPVASPGGWNIIGRTPLALFDPLREPPSLVQPGDTVHFVAISREQFDEQQRQASTGYPQKYAVSDSDIAGCEVLDPGALTTVQDNGRWGLQHLGVPVSGAMDRQALSLGNLLVGNEENEAALEITFSGPRLIFATDALVALTGADMLLSVDGRDLPAWTATLVHSGSILSVGQFTKTGYRAWLCVAGGISVPTVLGSRSTLLRTRLGGAEGRPLRAGDSLPLNPLTRESRRLEGFSCPMGLRPFPVTDTGIPVLPGPQLQSLAPAAQQAFLETTWTVSSNSDRMGMKLEGPVLRLSGSPDVISEVVPEGAIEVTGSGLPIIMLADRQTTGGYVKPFVIASAAVGRLAQLQPGDHIRFCLSTPNEARDLLKEQLAARNELRRLQDLWHQRRAGGILQITVNGAGHMVEWQDVTPLEANNEHHG